VEEGGGATTASKAVTAWPKNGKGMRPRSRAMLYTLYPNGYIAASESCPIPNHKPPSHCMWSTDKAVADTAKRNKIFID